MQTTPADEVRLLYANVLKALKVFSKSAAARINASVARPLLSLIESPPEFVNRSSADGNDDQVSEYQMIVDLADQATALSQKHNSAELFGGCGGTSGTCVQYRRIR